jgi:hypothetical protein
MGTDFERQSVRTTCCIPAQQAPQRRAANDKPQRELMRGEAVGSLPLGRRQDSFGCRNDVRRLIEIDSPNVDNLVIHRDTSECEQRPERSVFSDLEG